MSHDTNEDDTPPAALLDGMPPAWRHVYDQLRTAHTGAQLRAQADPTEEARAVLRATAAAARTFRRAYIEASTQRIADQLREE